MPAPVRFLVAVAIVVLLVRPQIAAEPASVDVVIESRKSSWSSKEAWYFDVTVKNRSDARIEVPFIYDGLIEIDGDLYSQFPNPRIEGNPKLVIGPGKDEKTTLTLNGKLFDTLDAKTGRVPLKLGAGEHTLKLILGEYRSKWSRSRSLNESGRSRPVNQSVWSATVIHVGAWSLAFSHPRTSRSTPDSTSRLVARGFSRKWSMRMPALRA
jgi:hypothetical protein